MTELSKTARASQVKETPKEIRAESTEEAIRQIRLNLEAKLYITPDRIAKLLAAYDAYRLALSGAEMEHAWVKTLESGKSYRVTLVHDEVSVEPIEEDTDWRDVSHIQLKDPEFDHLHEDENHLVDFGHTTVHPTAAGA